MNSKQHRDRSAPRASRVSAEGFSRPSSRAPTRRSGTRRAGEREREAEDDQQCRLRPEHSRLTRGYREI